ncbi:MAG: hypothetical protein BWY85_01624 [Firmicutes bacterium ADurb.Bin506]|nr:MAG: hypothetical protein BWY85_01624 [Firmicutes bacterium ADurb.Bin506]
MRTRRKIAKAVSTIGTPNTNTGTSSTSVAGVFRAPMAESPATVRPRNSAPASPMKILAGLKLYRRNPVVEPMRAADRTSSLAWPLYHAANAMAAAPMAVTPPAKPSKPSMKLTTFMNATIHNRVMGHDSQLR